MTTPIDQLSIYTDQLTRLLMQENDALFAMRSDEVAGNLSEKTRLFAALESLTADDRRGDATDAEISRNSPRITLNQSAQLQAALVRNRTLLRIALSAQRTLMTIITTAATRADEPQAYIMNGQMACSRQPAATTIAASV